GLASGPALWGCDRNGGRASTLGGVPDGGSTRTPLAGADAAGHYLFSRTDHRRCDSGRQLGLPTLRGGPRRLGFQAAVSRAACVSRPGGQAPMVPVRHDRTCGSADLRLADAALAQYVPRVLVDPPAYVGHGKLFWIRS